jgi:pSer/pThr/pTyr-binding forkhead associated (FHA) protein
MPTLVIRHPDGSQQEQDVSASLTVGRADGNDLVLVEGGVSRNHARFFVDDGTLKVEDVGSANGTWVDGARIEGAVALTAKSQVAIGDYEVSVKLGSKPLPRAAKPGAREPRETTKTEARPPKASGAPRSTRVVPAVKPTGGAALAKRPAPQRAAGPQLRGLSGPVNGKTFPLSGTMLIGRVAGVDLQVDDDSVSRRHAEVVVEGREVVLRDLGSANGTTVNGAPISEDALLNAGDIIQFGVVELQFETGAPAGARAGARKPGGELERPSRALRGAREARAPEPTALDEAARAPMDPKKKRLVIMGGSVLGLLFVMVLVKALITPPEVVDRGPTPLSGKAGGPVESDDPAEQIEAFLAECRQYSSSEVGRPDWKRAQAACDKIIELEPIHEEANQLLKKIRVEKQCEDHLDKAKELQASGRLDEAIDTYALVKPDCRAFFLRALSSSKDAVAEVKKQAGAECKTYATNAKWENAYRRCEVYMRLACQTMEPGDLYPPALTRLKLDGPLGKADWRPKDPLFINFLKAREKVKPGEPLWQCPELPVFRPPPPPKDQRAQVKEELSRRFKEKELGVGLTLYFDGKLNEAPVPIQKVLENPSKDGAHQEARALLLDVSNVINLYQNGVTELTNERPEKAEEPFRRALAIDEKLVLSDRAAKLGDEEKRRELDRAQSFVRRTIIETMSSNCYKRGKELADRKDFRQACRVWKLGASFSRGNIDLLKALTNVCTQRARTALEQAESCAQLRQVLDFAVDGDGFKQQAEAALAEQECN